LGVDLAFALMLGVLDFAEPPPMRSNDATIDFMTTVVTMKEDMKRVEMRVIARKSNVIKKLRCNASSLSFCSPSQFERIMSCLVIILLFA
jgi:hypothetical protein